MTYIQPVLCVLIVMILLGWFFWTRRWFGRNWIVPAAGLALFLWSWAPTGFVLSKSLEGWYAPGAMPPGDAEVIVVLGSGVKVAIPRGGGPIAGMRTAYRCDYAAWLYQNWKAVPILVGGGEAPLDVEEPVLLADVMRDVLLARGIPPESIWRESTSYSTYTNAVDAGGILRKRGIRKIVLVTDAHHMLRAELVFRGQGLDVVPAPCRFFAKLPARFSGYFPDTSAIEVNESVIHEWVGLLWYWISGKI